MSAEKYNTNLAAEYYVLSVLHRLGAEANLTLGNKKSVDIVVVRAAGDAVTIDVKGLAGTTSWPVDNVKAGKPNHFFVFVSFLGHIDDLSILPEVYVMPSERLPEFTYTTPGEAKRKFVELRVLRKRVEAKAFRDGWNLILRPNTTASSKPGSKSTRHAGARVPRRLA
jgi:hypothetical protein